MLTVTKIVNKVFFNLIDICVLLNIVQYKVGLWKISIPKKINSIVPSVFQ